MKEDPAQLQAEAARLAQVCAMVEVRIVRRVRELLDTPRFAEFCSTISEELTISLCRR
jgi:hypothetical protein